MAKQDDSPQIGLPIEVIDHSGEASAPQDAPHGYVRKIPLLLLISGLLFTGAVIGLYVQPPGVQKFFDLVGLESGGGSSTPFALPPDLELPQDMLETLQISDVVGLLAGRQDLVPTDTAAGIDARVFEILVRLDKASSQVAAGYTNLEAVARVDTRAAKGTTTGTITGADK